MTTFRFMLRLALACALLALLSLPFGDALNSWFMQGFTLCLIGAVAVSVSELLRTMFRGFRFFLTGRDD